MSYKIIIIDEDKAVIKEARTYYRKILAALSKRYTANLKNTVTKN